MQWQARRRSAVIRRRLGDVRQPAGRSAAARIGDGIDWYAAQDGAVRRFADLSEAEQAETLATVDRHLVRKSTAS
jgi:hypothetical protein